MNDLLQNVHQLNKMVLNGEALEAFERFYHEDVEMQENDAPPTKGKAANRQREAEFFSSITEFRSASVREVAVGENVTICEWHFDYTHSAWGVRNYSQVSVQNWQDGLIVRERFFYGN